MEVGTVYKFTWYTMIGTNSLYLSRNEGVDWTLLTTVSGVDDPETILEYEWRVTPPESSGCYAKVVDSFDDEEVIGSRFTITADIVTRRVLIV